MTGAVHVTGGGIPGKLGRILHESARGAILDNLFPPAESMLFAQREGKVSDTEAYRAWNMGQGLLIVTPTPAIIQKCAERMGFCARIAGRIIDSPEITIVSRGAITPCKPLIFK
ncbi:MAG: hypothetical protein KGI45_00515 [Patescibacteria group bacterium]|nr:hypothetical protein [Patescibacteria group bacterium]